MRGHQKLPVLLLEQSMAVASMPAPEGGPQLLAQGCYRDIRDIAQSCSSTQQFAAHEFVPALSDPAATSSSGQSAPKVCCEKQCFL